MNKLCITDFRDIDEAIIFAKKFWPDQNSDAIRSMQIIQIRDLKVGAGWSCMISVCDICGKKQITFIPTCNFENEITGIKCADCGNMSVYPKEEEIL